MKKSVLMIALSSLALGACANSHQNPFASQATTSAVAGVYRSDESVPQFKEFLQIDAHAVTLTLVCKNSRFGQMVNYVRGQSRNEAKIQATAPARITDGTIEILADAEQAAPEVNSSCVAKLAKGVYGYSIDDATSLTLVSADGQKVTYTKMGVETPSLTERVKARAVHVLGMTRAGLDAADRGLHAAALKTGATVKSGVERFGRYTSLRH